MLELGLRLGTGAGFVERVLRQAIEESPELDAYRPWLAAEFRRGLARELTDAGRALSRYDAEPWAGQLGLPAAMLITTRDRLTRQAAGARRGVARTRDRDQADHAAYQRIPTIGSPSAAGADCGTAGLRGAAGATRR